MDCLFFGTPELARRVLEEVGRRHRVVMAVTRPDRPAGRHRKPVPPPVKEHCLAAGIPFLQPESLRDRGVEKVIGAAGAKVGVVFAYGGYLPPRILSLFPLGCVNLHPSLLPAYRGAAPANWAVIRGERRTGVTVFRVTGDMDAGPILGRREVSIGREETAGELLERLVTGPGTELLLAVLDGLEAGGVEERPQEESMASHAPRLRKEDGLIDWSRPAPEVVNLVRGVSPWPGAYTFHGGRLVKILEAAVRDGAGGEPGTVVEAKPGKEPLVAAGGGLVALRKLQREGGKPVAGSDFLKGARWSAGEKLG